MSPIKRFLVIILFIGLVKPAFAQNVPVTLTRAIKAKVVDSLSLLLIKRYIYLDTALKMSDRIKTRLKTGAYDTINKPDDFAQILNSDLGSVYKDLHMRIYYDPGFEKALRTRSYMESVSRRMQFLQMAKQRNYGFREARIMDGNIGYISITQFYDVNEQSEAVADNLFSFLKNANALIIDVRDNPGGEPDMVKYIISHFFKARTHLNDFCDRHSITNAYWTDQLSDSSAFSAMPLYILVNEHTYSAAEEFAYDLQSLHRATIIGKTTGGAAHWVTSSSLGNGFIGNIPFRKAVNPYTHTNWEKVGVKPDVNGSDENALDLALLTAYKNIISTSKYSFVTDPAKWHLALLDAKLHHFELNTKRLQSYTGNYSGRLITLKNGLLYFTDANGYHIGLLPISATTFTFTNNDRHIEFTAAASGKIIGLAFIYPDGRVEKFNRR